MKHKKEQNSNESRNGYETPTRKTPLNERTSKQRSKRSNSEKNDYARDSYTNVTKEISKLLYFMDGTNAEKLSMPDKLAAAVHYIAFLENALVKLEPESDNAQECLLLMDLFGECPSEIVTEDESHKSEMGHDAKFDVSFELQTLASATSDNLTTGNTTLGANAPNYVIYYHENFTEEKTKIVKKTTSGKHLPLRTKDELVNKSFHELHAEIWKKLHTRAIEIVRNLETLQTNSSVSNEHPKVETDVSANTSTTPTHASHDLTSMFTTTTGITIGSSSTDARLLLSLRRPVHFSPSRTQLLRQTEQQAS